MVADIFKRRFAANFLIAAGSIVTFVNFIQACRVNFFIQKPCIEFIPIRRIQGAQIQLLLTGVVINVISIYKWTVESVFLTTWYFFPTLVLRIVLVAVCRNIGTSIVGAGNPAADSLDTRGIVDSIQTIAVWRILAIPWIDICQESVVIWIILHILRRIIISVLILNYIHPLQISFFRIVDNTFIYVIAIPFTDIVTPRPQIAEIRDIITA